MCVYFSDPDWSVKNGVTRLKVVKAVIEGQWLQAQVHLRGFDTLNFFFAKQLCGTVSAPR